MPLLFTLCYIILLAPDNISYQTGKIFDTRNNNKMNRVTIIAATIATMAGCSQTTPPPQQSAVKLDQDYIWLEEVEGEQ